MCWRRSCRRRAPGRAAWARARAPAAKGREARAKGREAPGRDQGAQAKAPEAKAREAQAGGLGAQAKVGDTEAPSTTARTPSTTGETPATTGETPVLLLVGDRRGACPAAVALLLASILDAASGAHSSLHAEPRQDDRLQQDPHDQKADRPPEVHYAPAPEPSRRASTRRSLPSTSAPSGASSALATRDMLTSGATADTTLRPGSVS